MAVDETGGVVGDMPHIPGSRVSVHHIVRAFRDRDYTIEEIADRVYPHLSEQEVREALIWVLDNQEAYHDAVDAHRATENGLKSQLATVDDFDIDQSDA